MPVPQTILLIDDSVLVTSVLKETLRPHFSTVMIANSKQAALALIDQAIDLVLCDIHLGDGDGFEILAAVNQLARPPRLVFCSARVSEEVVERTIAAGALGLLAKPFSARQVLALWRRSERSNLVARAQRVRLLANVVVSDQAGAPILSSEVHDLSTTGAFVVTGGPLPLDTRLHLTIIARERRFVGDAIVVRVHEPSWTHPGGVGIRFEPLSPADRAVLDEIIDIYG